MASPNPVYNHSFEFGLTQAQTNNIMCIMLHNVPFIANVKYMLVKLYYLKSYRVDKNDPYGCILISRALVFMISYLGFLETCWNQE